jgi:hypothetical protein
MRTLAITAAACVAGLLLALMFAPDAESPMEELAEVPGGP